ncbi:DUF4265 domain-containing protein [Mucilaginibacter sp. cycad4]|uniref:DUF4265 domain-containing protein n=1 Tax=Mucilaginibacter sp. cycad4 TaxID=3342096 RepID=UPI002AAB152C|nr:DUF4265 domain-containing protein [Mucilaginibacter gossypii]WPV00462.1 DUF4265 domain-containing protein [Mucilaginibacter gossypii]
MGDDKHVKILFRLYSDILEETTVETMWAKIVNEEQGLYALDNIPFYLPVIAAGDIVFAEYDTDEQMLTYRETREYSGNSTIHVILMSNTADLKSIGKLFEELGCNWEGMDSKYFALDVPASVNYSLVKARLEELKERGIIDYAESCLSEGHQIKNYSQL